MLQWRRAMRVLLTTIAAAATLIVTCSVADRPNATPLSDPSGFRAAIEDLTVIDKVQYFLGGKRYCFYRNGWHGPGWYVCGFNDIPGTGWGGPPGWRGWEVGGGADRVGGGGGSGGGSGPGG